VHCGADPAFRPRTGRSSEEPPYLLYVGAHGPHKGYAEAFAVAAQLTERGLPHRLKVVGAIARRVKPLVTMELNRATHADRVDLLGFVPFDELVRLYAHADAVVVTSRYEGFGLPALEAMASGTPVVAFANSSIPEVVGDGGVLVPDGDVEAFAAAVRRVVTDDHRWTELSQAAAARASTFSWDVAAAAHAEIYRAVAG
jgi:glycosyltransferase involved in cell wall biosynthesis